MSLLYGSLCRVNMPDTAIRPLWVCQAFICRITLQAYITFALNWRDVCAKMKKRGLDETRTECLSV